jgi:Tol biopolymer transport system component
LGKENEMKTTKILAILVLTLAVAAKVANADFVWGTPTNLGPPVNTSALDSDPSISADGLTLYFHSHRSVVGDLWVSTRATTNDPWGEPMNLGPTVNSSGDDKSPFISADGLTLFFASDRPGGYGGRDIYITSRQTTDADWSAPVNLGPTVNSSADEVYPRMSADGLQLYFSEWDVFRPGGYGRPDIWVTTRDTASDPWGTPVNLGPTVNSSAWDYGPSISADGLLLFFISERPGGPGGYGDIWVTRRVTTDNDWGTPVNLGPTVNSSAGEGAPHISADGSTLFFSSRRPGGIGHADLWQVSISPVVDFNGDGIVDSADMWPWGDGIVDVQDLIVLAEHLFEEVYDPTLVAHWKLDEAEGDIAYDSIGVYDGVLNGVPTWQPTGGAVDGALEFDGIDDYVSTSFILDPADAVFSVLAWVKGAAPGQVIISQTGGANWLLADPSEGKLRTSLLRPGGGRTAPQPLISEFIITDGNWHRIGFVWDGSNRILYVDDVEVGRDTQDSLEGSEGGLYIGAGNALDSGSFWSGLIDDVRIYNRAITP